jgi:small GTP-binding protein
MNSLQTIPAFKVVLLGDSGVGKTSITQYLQRQICDPTVETTIGASFISQDLLVNGSTITLHIWDTAGQERYRSLVPTYSRGAHAALIVFDLASISSFENLDFWIKTFREACGIASFVFIIGNKCDLPTSLLREKADQWTKKQQLKFFSVSAKTGFGIQEMFQNIAEEITMRKPQDFRELAVQESPPKVERGCC